MSRTIIIEPEADDDLARAFAWYEEANPGVGHLFIHAMRDAVVRLTKTPDGSTSVPGAPIGHVVRRVFPHRFPYAVVFVVKADVIHVIAFAHTRRRPGYWHERLPR